MEILDLLHDPDVKQQGMQIKTMITMLEILDLLHDPDVKQQDNQMKTMIIIWTYDYCLWIGVNCWNWICYLCMTFAACHFIKY